MRDNNKYQGQLAVAKLPLLQKSIIKIENGNCDAKKYLLLAPQSGALRINAYRDFLPIKSHPILPLIAFEHLSLSMVI